MPSRASQATDWLSNNCDLRTVKFLLDCAGESGLLDNIDFA